MRAQRGRDCRGNFVVGFQSFPFVICRFEKEPRERNGLPGRTGQPLRLINLRVCPLRLPNQSQYPR
jgi:hypothetical protein